MSLIQQYEMLKQEWVNNHPEATYQEYQAAMREIAERLGV